MIHAIGRSGDTIFLRIGAGADFPVRLGRLQEALNEVLVDNNPAAVPNMMNGRETIFLTPGNSKVLYQVFADGRLVCWGFMERFELSVLQTTSWDLVSS